MPIDILMPALSHSIEHATLSRWMKREGDAIQAGDILAEIETDKTVLEIKSAHEGILSRILVPDGTIDVQVNTPIAVVLSAGERLVEESKVENSRLRPRGVTEFDASAYKKGNSELPLPNGETRIFASPRAKRLASEARIDLATIDGSGPLGRIIEKDILAAQASRSITHPDPVGLQSGPLSNRTAANSTAVHRAEGVALPHNAMRRTIARRLSSAFSAANRGKSTMSAQAMR